MRITVRDLMVPVTAVAKNTMSIAAARSLMLRWNAGETYVVDRRGKLLGIVPGYEFLKAELAGVRETEPVTVLLSARVAAVEADADIASVTAKFREGWCSRMPVTDKGRLVGQLTRNEILRMVTHLRMVASVTEASVEATITGPHFAAERERLTPIRRRGKTATTGGRRVRRLAKAG